MIFVLETPNKVGQCPLLFFQIISNGPDKQICVIIVPILQPDGHIEGRSFRGTELLSDFCPPKTRGLFISRVYLKFIKMLCESSFVMSFYF